MTSPSTQRTNAMDTPVVVASRKARYDIYPQSHHQLHHQPGTSSSPRTFDMKTLLAKPAPPYARGNGYGSGSESEGVGRISSERDRRVRTRTSSRQKVDEGPSAEGKEAIMNELTFDHGSPPLDLSLELVPAPTSPPSPEPSTRMERTTSRTTTASASKSENIHPSSPVSVPASPTKPNKRVRNVLRRRPSVVKDREREFHRFAHAQELPSSPIPPISTKSSSSMLRLSNIRIPNTPLFSGRTRSRSPSSSSPRNASASTSPWSSSAAAMSPPSSVWPSPPVATPSSPNPNIKRKPVDYSKLSNPTHAEMPVLTDSMTRKPGPTTTERTRGTKFKQAEVDPDKPPSSRRSSSNKGTMSPPPGSPIRKFPFFGSSSSKPNSPSPVPSSSSAGSSVLTPAGAVAEAYRRQVGTAQAVERPYPYRLPTLSTSSLSFGRPLDNRSTDALSLGLLSNATLDDDDERSGRWGHVRRMRGSTSDREDGTGFDIITRHHLSPPASASGHDQPDETLPRHVQQNPALKQLTEEEESQGPYYSVLGSTTGRLIAVGGPDDHHLSWTPELSANLLRRSSGANILVSGGSGDTSTAIAGSSGGAVGVVKTITRKVSGRFRRSGEGNDGAKDDRKRSESRRGVSVERGGERRKDRRDTSKGRPSLQDDRSGYFSAGEASRKSSRRQRAISPDTRALEAQKQQYRRSLRLSIDKFVDEDVPIASTKLLSRTSSVSASRVSKQAPPKSRRTKSAFGGTTSTIDDHISQRLSNEVSSGATSFPVDPPSNELSSPSPASASSSGGGNRIWKLMKRISTGGLREKYSQTQQLADAPPVPPLPPAQTAAATSPPITSQKHTDRTPRASLNPPPRRNMSNPTSAIAPEATPPIATPQRSRVTSPSSPSQQSPGHSSAHSHAQSSNTTRPSTTTRSSSPSSAMFSTYSAPLQASGHSSASSLPNSAQGHGADESKIPPLPKFAQWIVPPSELKKMYEETPVGSENDQLSQNGSSARRHKLRLTMPAAPSPSSLTRPSYGEDYAMLPTPSAQLASLPVPPRRPRTAPTSPSAEAMKFASSAIRSPSKDSFLESLDADDETLENSRVPSPDIPTFSTAAPINAFRTRKSSNNATKLRPSPSATGSTQGSSSTYNSPAGSPGALSPPPRPTRSRMRPAPSPSPSPPDSAGLSAATPASTTSQEVLNTALDLKRRSTSAQSTMSTATARPIETRHSRHRSGSLSLFRLSASLSGSSGVSPSAGGVRTRISSTPSSPQKAANERFQTEEPSKNGFFRSFGRMTGKQLTDKEKNDRWEDLLQRSDRAGGTLHLEVIGGEHGLSSDQLRFSQLTIDDN